ncbi:MAG: fructosamine kinase family protein [Burkholderiales bacterium]
MISARLARELGLYAAAPVHGGCIHRCYRALRGGRPLFVKLNEPGFAAAFAAEADGLVALRAAGCRAPAPIAHGIAADHAYLLLEWLDLRSSGDFAAMGAMLAAMHRARGDAYGWPRDNYIGRTPQANSVCESWMEFWRDRRLAPQLALARGNGHRVDAPDVWRVLEGHNPPPCLVHGDLWSGNAAFTAGGEPALFDPAVYHGDRETDLAMTELFGGFPAEFYEAYNEAWPLERGYELRKPLYNLYHLLNHLNLFGAGYLAQVRAALRLLADAL